MKKCYANNDLAIAKEPFAAPQNIQIQIDCSKEKEDDPTGIDFDF